MGRCALKLPRATRIIIIEKDVCPDVEIPFDPKEEVV
jgi:hypothetical protein